MGGEFTYQPRWDPKTVSGRMTRVPGAGGAMFHSFQSPGAVPGLRGQPGLRRGLPGPVRVFPVHLPGPQTARAGACRGSVLLGSDREAKEGQTFRGPCQVCFHEATWRVQRRAEASPQPPVAPGSTRAPAWSSGCSAARCWSTSRELLELAGRGVVE